MMVKSLRCGKFLRIMALEPLSDCEPDNIYEKSIEYIYRIHCISREAKGENQ